MVSLLFLVLCVCIVILVFARNFRGARWVRGISAAILTYILACWLWWFLLYAHWIAVPSSLGAPFWLLVPPLLPSVLLMFWSIGRSGAKR